MNTSTAIVAIVALFLGASVKSISGIGLPVIAIPVISAVSDIETAVAVVALPNLMVNLAMAWRTRQHARETRDLSMLGLTGAVGGAVGTAALVSWSEEPLVAILVAVVLFYIAVYLLSPTFRVSPTSSRRLSPAVGTAAGLLQGAIGISGPVVGAWIHSYRLDRGAHIFSVTVLFALAGGSQLAALIAGGNLDGRWTVALISCVPAVATVPIGERLRNRFSAEGFERFVVATIAITVLALAVRTFT